MKISVLLCVFNGEIFGKPKDMHESKNMLKALSGNSHKVITGVTIMNESIGALKTFSDVTEVFVGQIPIKEIEYYIRNFNTLEIIMLWGSRYQNFTDI